MLEIDCMNCRNTEEYSTEEQGKDIFCSRCFSMINTDTGEVREPTKKELLKTISMFDSEHSNTVLANYYL